MKFRQGPKGRKASERFIKWVESLPMGKCDLCGAPTREGDWFDAVDGYKGPLFNHICEKCYLRQLVTGVKG